MRLALSTVHVYLISISSSCSYALWMLPKADNFMDIGIKNILPQVLVQVSIRTGNAKCCFNKRACVYIIFIKERLKIAYMSLSITVNSS